MINLARQNICPGHGISGGEPQFHLVHDNGRKVLEVFYLVIVNGPRCFADDAEGAEIKSVTSGQRYASIKAQPKIPGDEWIGERARIDARIR